MRVSKLYQKRDKLITGFLLLGIGFILAPLCIPLVYLVTPYFILLFPVLMLGGLIKIFANCQYLGKEASRLLWAALIIFVLSLFVVGLADARFVVEGGDGQLAQPGPG